MADHVLAVVRKMFNWHATRDDDFVSPIVKGMARTRPLERARDRTLSDAEIKAVWTALGEMGDPFKSLVKLLFLTAQRRGEIANMQWHHLRHDYWEIPASLYKTKRTSVVPLTLTASAIIEAMPKLGGYVFTSMGDRPFDGFSKAKRALDELSGVMNWRLHDIRRTSRSLMSRAGIRRDVAEQVLGHVIPGVAGVYDRHDYVTEKKTALVAL